MIKCLSGKGRLQGCEGAAFQPAHAARDPARRPGPTRQFLHCTNSEKSTTATHLAIRLRAERQLREPVYTGCSKD
jgi:hypothetical protein